MSTQTTTKDAEFMELASAIGKTVEELKAMDEATLRLLPPAIQQKIRELKQSIVVPAQETATDSQSRQQEADHGNGETAQQVQPVNQQQNAASGGEQENNSSGVDDGKRGEDRQEAENNGGAMSEVELLRKALNSYETRHKTLQGKYNAEGKRNREEIEALKAQLAKATGNAASQPQGTVPEFSADELNALAARGWDGDDVKELARIILSKATPKTDEPKKNEEANTGRADANQAHQSQSDPDTMINANLVTSIGVSLKQFSEIPNVKAHMLTIADQNGNTAQDLYDAALDKRNFKEAAEILADVHSVLKKSGIVSQTEKQDEQRKTGQENRAVAPSPAVNGKVDTPPAKPDYAAAKRNVEIAQAAFQKNANPTTTAALEAAKKAYEQALKT